MDAQTITARMLRSISASKPGSMRALLLAFGVTNPTKLSMPPVFDTKYATEWDAFVSSNSFSAPNHELRLLYTILEFIRYMRYSRVNPFFRKVNDPETRGPLNLNTVYKRLARERLDDYLSAIVTGLRKYNLFMWLQRQQSIDYIDLVGDSLSITTYTLLEPKRKNDSLDNILLKLQGLLYTGKLPMQLGERLKKGSHKSSLPDFNSAATKRASNFGWLLLASDKKYKLAIRRVSGSKLLLRIQTTVPNEIDLGNKTETKKLVANMWKALRLAQKL